MKRYNLTTTSLDALRQRAVWCLAVLLVGSALLHGCSDDATSSRQEETDGPVRRPVNPPRDRDVVEDTSRPDPPPGDVVQEVDAPPGDTQTPNDVVEQPEVIQPDVVSPEDTDTTPGDVVVCPQPPLCPLGETRCAGNVIERCERLEDGCAGYALFKDCAEDGPEALCQDPFQPAVCVEPPDPCEGLVGACAEEGVRCSGNSLKTCAPNADGCLVESAVDCLAQSQVCRGSEAPACVAPECGDGRIDAPLEACDTGEGEPSPGCVDCQITSGWRCSGQPSVCIEEPCGNGVLEPEFGEECDDGNRTSGDGCSADCLIEGTLSCPSVRARLSCPGGRVRDSNAQGRRDYDRYVCAPNNRYASPELVYEFRGAPGQRVRAVLAGASRARDIDFFVLRAEGANPSCGNNMSCVTASTGEESMERVSFVTEAGATYAWVIDGVSNGGFFDPPRDTTDFDLFWICEEEACGDGVTTGEETCDHGGALPHTGCGQDCRALPGYVCGREPGTCVEIPCTDGERPGSRCPGVIPVRSVGPIEIRGSLSANDPRFRRPDESCRAGSTERPYDAFTLRNVDTLPVFLDVVATWSGDGYLHAYSSFDPAAPTANCLGGNDDLTGTRNSGISVFVPANAEITIVASTFGSSPIGNYTISVTPAWR